MKCHGQGWMLLVISFLLSQLWSRNCPYCFLPMRKWRLWETKHLSKFTQVAGIRVGTGLQLWGHQFQWSSHRTTMTLQVRSLNGRYQWKNHNNFGFHDSSSKKRHWVAFLVFIPNILFSSVSLLRRKLINCVRQVQNTEQGVGLFASVAEDWRPPRGQELLHGPAGLRRGARRVRAARRAFGSLRQWLPNDDYRSTEVL